MRHGPSTALIVIVTLLIAPVLLTTGEAPQQRDQQLEFISMDVTGNVFSSVGSLALGVETNFVVSLKNTGDETLEDLDVEIEVLNDQDGIVKAESESISSIEADQVIQKEVRIRWTPSEEGEFWARASLSGMDNPPEDLILPLPVKNLMDLSVEIVSPAGDLWNLGQPLEVDVALQNVGNLETTSVFNVNARVVGEGNYSEDLYKTIDKGFEAGETFTISFTWLDLIEPGNYTLSVNHTYEFDEEDGNDSVEMTITLGENLVDATISGRCTTPAGPASWATVKANGTGFITVADEVGYYQLNVWPFENYNLAAELYGYDPVFVNNVEVYEGDVDCVNFTFTEKLPTGNLSGWVVLEGQGNLTNVTVEVLSTPLSARCNESGFYRISGIVESEVEVVASMPGREGASTTATVVAGRETENVNLTLTGSRDTITVNIPTVNGLVSTTENALDISFGPDVDPTTVNSGTITLESEDGEAMYINVLHREGNNYTLELTEQLEPDTNYTLALGTGILSTDGNPVFTQDHLVAFRTSGPESIIPQVVDYSPKTTASPVDSITITFTTPMDPANVEDNLVFDPTLNHWPPAWSNGETMISITPYDPLEPGEYTVSLYGDALSSEGVSMGSPFSWTFRVPSDSTSYTGQVVYEAGKGIPNVQVTLTSVDDPSRTYEATTDDQGRYSFPDVAVGTYIIKIEKANFVSHSETVIIDENSYSHPNVLLEPSRIGDVENDEDDEALLDGATLYLLVLILIIIVLAVILLMTRTRGTEEEEEPDRGRYYGAGGRSRDGERRGWDDGSGQGWGDEWGEGFECPNCGYGVTDADEFCPDCGAEFIPNEFSCPQCGESIEPDTEVCPNCSYEFTLEEGDAQEMGITDYDVYDTPEPMGPDSYDIFQDPPELPMPSEEEPFTDPDE